MWCEKNNSCKDQTIEDKTEYLPSTLLVNFSRWETKKKRPRFKQEVQFI